MNKNQPKKKIKIFDRIIELDWKICVVLFVLFITLRILAPNNTGGAGFGDVFVMGQLLFGVLLFFKLFPKSNKKIHKKNDSLKISVNKPEAVEKQNGSTLLASNLSQKMWWRFAQAIFMLSATIIAIHICVGAGAVINETDTLVKNESTLICNGGQKYALDSIIEKLRMYSIDSSDINNGRFSGFENDAKVKIFCLAMNVDLIKNPPIGQLLLSDLDSGASDQEVQESFAISAVSTATKKDDNYFKEISEQELTSDGKDMGYMIYAVYDYKMIWSIIGIAASALFGVGILLFTIRGIAGYILTSKFL